MKTLLIRHAIAEEREDFAKTGKPDSLRPLTRDGRTKMRQMTGALAKLVPDVDIIATSPFTRCLQTAKIVSSAWPEAEIVKLASLEPDGSHDEFLKWLAERSQMRCVAVVGHEPSMSALFSRMLAAEATPFFEFKKGGAALLHAAEAGRKGDARLEWAIQPAALRMIAKGSR